jgi:hypothetical protein
VNATEKSPRHERHMGVEEACFSRYVNPQE